MSTTAEDEAVQICQHPTPAAPEGDAMVRDLADYDRAFGLGEVSQP